MKKVLILSCLLVPSLLKAETVTLNFTKEAKKCLGGIHFYASLLNEQQKLSHTYKQIPALLTLSGFYQEIKAPSGEAYLVLEVLPGIDEQEFVQMCADLALNNGSYAIGCIDCPAFSCVYEFEKENAMGNYIDRATVLDGSYFESTQHASYGSESESDYGSEDDNESGYESGSEQQQVASISNWRNYGIAATCITFLGALGVIAYKKLNKDKENNNK